jgi:DNA replication protein DnaC
MDFKLDLQQPAEIVEALQRYSDDPHGFLLLVGKNGTGKSYAAQQILSVNSRKQKFHDSDHRKFITLSNLNIAWQHQLKEWGDSKYMLDQYNLLRMMVLDDMGIRQPSDAFLDFLYAIIDYRCDNRSSISTIVTTNLNSKDMRLKFGDAITSRICSGMLVKFEGDDKRFLQW